MTEDHEGDHPRPDESGEPSEEQVARLLAELGSDPLPPAVRDRLDITLADLVEERGSGARDPGSVPAATDAEVVALAPRRRGRVAGRRLLVAAAVLGVAGIGVTVADDLIAGDASPSSTAGDAESDAGTADSAGAGRGEDSLSSPETGYDTGLEADGGAALSRTTASASTVAGLRSLLRAVAADPVLLSADTLVVEDRGSFSVLRPGGDALRDVRASCRQPRLEGRVTRVLLDYRGEPATLAVRREGDRVTGEVYSCSLGLLVDGVAIPTPAE